MKNLLRTQLKRLLRRFGHAFPCEDYLNKYVFGYHLAGLFRRLDIQCVLDVGAHCGGYAQFLRNEVGFRGLIVSFEPALANLAVLRRRAARDPKWVVYDHALGSESRLMTLNVMKSSVFNSFLKPDHVEVPDFESRNQLDHMETVQVHRLDEIFEQLDRKHGMACPYLKVDTQGFDLEVLRGAEGVLNRFHAVQAEASIQPLYVGATPFAEVLRHLSERRFEPTGMFPVVRDERLRLVEFDLVMVRRAGP